MILPRLLVSHLRVALSPFTTAAGNFTEGLLGLSAQTLVKTTLSLRWISALSQWSTTNRCQSHYAVNVTCRQAWIMGVEGLDPLKICRRVRVCFDPSPKMSYSFIQGTKDIIMSKMEGKTNFSRRLKQFGGLTWLTARPHILWRIYATARRHQAYKSTNGLWNPAALSHCLHCNCKSSKAKRTYETNVACV